MNSVEQFAEKKYFVTKCFENATDCDKYLHRMFALRDSGELDPTDSQVVGSLATYGKFDDLLEEKCADIGNIIGKKLYPTYTYARIYGAGQQMIAHKDRPSCEYSATLTLGHSTPKPWPIYFGPEEESILAGPSTELFLEQNEMVVYSGCKLTHWRLPWNNATGMDWQVQVFLHYVDANGPYADHKFDRRPALGLPDSTKENRGEVADKNTNMKISWEL